MRTRTFIVTEPLESSDATFECLDDSLDNTFVPVSFPIISTIVIHFHLHYYFITKNAYKN